MIDCTDEDERQHLVKEVRKIREILNMEEEIVQTLGYSYLFESPKD